MDEMEALRLTNQRFLREFEQLTRHIQRPQEAQQAREGQNAITRGEQHFDPPPEADGEEETSHAREHDSYKPPGEDRNEERHGRNNKGDGPIPYQ